MIVACWCLLRRFTTAISSVVSLSRWLFSIPFFFLSSSFFHFFAYKITSHLQHCSHHWIILTMKHLRQMRAIEMIQRDLMLAAMGTFSSAAVFDVKWWGFWLVSGTLPWRKKNKQTNKINAFFWDIIVLKARIARINGKCSKCLVALK